MLATVDPGSQPDRFDLEVIWRAERYQRWIIDAFECDLSGEVLEIGAGVGAMTRWLSARARHVTALEPDEGYRARIDGLRLPNVSTIGGRVEDLAGTSLEADAAVLVNILEHLDDDAAALTAIHARLRPGGLACILVPAHHRLFGSLDEAYGHRRRYSTAQVGRLLARSGFAVDRLRYFNPVGAAGWLVMGRLLQRRTISARAVTLAEWVVVPASRALEALGDPPFGQSVIAVGRRAT